LARRRNIALPHRLIVVVGFPLEMVLEEIRSVEAEVFPVAPLANPKI